jgi:hypothetical protein
MCITPVLQAAVQHTRVFDVYSSARVCARQLSAAVLVHVKTSAQHGCGCDCQPESAVAQVLPSTTVVLLVAVLPASLSQRVAA